MGTRGIWGFKFNDEYKVTYNHFDSYLDGLGCNLKEELRNYDLDFMRKRFPLIIVVKDTDIPAKGIVEKLIEKKYIDKLSGMNGEDIYSAEWYSILRGWQGCIKPYMEYDMPYMCDGFEYATDWIEFSYIIDLDSGSFITYKNYFQNEGEDIYLPVSIKLTELNQLSDNAYVSIITNNWGKL